MFFSSPCEVEAVSTFDKTVFDCIVLVADSLDNVTGELTFLKDAFAPLLEVRFYLYVHIGFQITIHCGNFKVDNAVGIEVVLAPLPGPFIRAVEYNE